MTYINAAKYYHNIWRGNTSNNHHTFTTNISQSNVYFHSPLTLKIKRGRSASLAACLSSIYLQFNVVSRSLFKFEINRLLSILKICLALNAQKFRKNHNFLQDIDDRYRGGQKMIEVVIFREGSLECKDAQVCKYPIQLRMTEKEFNLDAALEEPVLPDWLPRQKSNDSAFNELLLAPTYGQRPLIFPFNPPTVYEADFPTVFKPKARKPKEKKSCDYRKNICGYITKKIMREFLSINYMEQVTRLCHKHTCDYHTAKSYILTKIERVTGPSHVPALFTGGQQWERSIKAAFGQFFLWFAQERYLRYLILEGKMEQKEVYIEYKNTFLLSLVKKAILKQQQSDILVKKLEPDSQ